MPGLLQRRLAGFRFEAVPPDLPEKLPRMDIAAFVGFAAAGPMQTPVVIEDIAHFLAIFGEDVPLAWDGTNHRTVWAQLGPAVRAFFQNGGRRCWVIRVAGKHETNRFPLPGMVEVTASELRPAYARARSPGSWFDQFECATALSVELVEVTDWDGAGNLTARLRSKQDLAPGDLLRLTTSDSTRQSFFLVKQLQPLPSGQANAQRQLFEVQGDALGWFEMVDPTAFDSIDGVASWAGTAETPNAPIAALSASAHLVGAPSSPPKSVSSGSLALELLLPDSPPGDFLAPSVGSLVRLQTDHDVIWFWGETAGRGQTQETSPSSLLMRLEGKGLWQRQSAGPLPSNATIIAEKLTFEIHVKSAQHNEQVMSKLGFAWDHPYYWNALPDDEEAFQTDNSTGQSRLSPNDPHAALQSAAVWTSQDSGRFPLAGDGDRAAVFLPLFVPAYPAPFLSALHSRNDELTRDGLNKFSAGLFLDPDLLEPTAETLLGEADFIRYQRPVRRRLSGIHAALDVEEATLIAVPDAVHAGWIPSAIVDPPPPEPAPFLPHPGWGLSDQCDYDPNPPVGEEPRRDKFLECALRVLEPPGLALQEGPDPAGTFTLEWESAGPDVRFILHQAAQPNFSDATEVYRGTEQQRTFFGRRPGAYYYQVRAVAACATSNWSQRIRVFVPPGHRYELLPVKPLDSGNGPNTFSTANLLDVHRSLLRLCAARGDLFAVLATPQHFRADDCLQYVALLKATGTEAERIPTATLPIGLGEGDVFSFGSIYHPWVVSRRDDGELLYSPPDGAAVSIIARRSLERGAWLAPANEVFRGMIALAPLLPTERQLDLLISQFNQVLDEPEGFLTRNADTLSDVPELRPINVRRLLILLRRAALRLGATYVFEPNGPALRRLVHHGFDSLLSQLFVRGAFAGDTRAESYEVVIDDSINTPTTSDLGQFRVDLKVAPSLAMTFVTVRLVQTGDQGVTTEVI
jgi:hypothetical protein